VINEKIHGQWGLVVICKDEPKKIVVARKGSPILIGLSNEAIFVASEKIAFEKYTSQYFDVQEGEIIELDLDKR